MELAWFVFLSLFGTVLCQGERHEVVVPASATIHEAGTLRVTCNITNSDEPWLIVQYTWTREDEPAFKPVQSQDLVVEHVMTSDAGVYTCTVQVVSLPKWSSTGQTRVLVEFSPRWEIYAPTRFAAKVGDTVSMFCCVRAFPVVNFSWTSVTTGMSRVSRDQAYYSELRISLVIERDYGNYRCDAQNVAGKSAFTLRLERPGVPDSPFFCDLLNVSSTAAVLACLPGFSGGAPNTYPVYTSDTKRAPTRQETVSNKVIITVGELQPNMSYVLHVYAENEHGVSQESTGVYLETTGKRPVDADGPVLPLPIIIGVAAGSAAVLLIFLLVIIVVIAKKRARKSPNSTPAKKSVGRSNSYRASGGQSDNNSNAAHEPTLHSRDSFREATRWRGSGIAGSPSQASVGTNMTAVSPGSGHLQLIGINPGEESSDYGFTDREVEEEPEVGYGEQAGIGFDNIAYNPDSLLDTSTDRAADAARRREHRRMRTVAVNPDSYHAARALGKNQVGLAGMGALSGLPYGSQVLYRPPGTEVHPGTERRHHRESPRQQPVLSEPVTSQPALPQREDSIIHEQPILKPLNNQQQQRTQAGCMNDLNQPGPQTVPIRTTDKYNVKPQHPAARQPQHPGGHQHPGEPQHPVGGHPGQTYSLPEELYEFPRERLNLRQRIGDGLYGEVWRARADGIMGRRGQIVVAVKMLKDDYTSEERRAILRELKVMKSLQPHPNIISLLGCCTLTDPLYIIMEYAGKGSLQYVLRSYRLPWSDNPDERYSPYANLPPVKRLTACDLIKFAVNIASGMEYISSRELLHRDLAARNILVEDHYVCKISDFGSSRDIAQSRQYESRTQNRLPIRWMAPESLYDCMYSVKSDVWSFGVLLWEVVTLGSSPYPGMSGADVMELVKRGYRMDKPHLCSDSLYRMMRECWRHDPRKRPSFTDLIHHLTTILSAGAEIDMEVAQMTDNFYEILEDLPGEKC